MENGFLQIIRASPPPSSAAPPATTTPFDDTVDLPGPNSTNLSAMLLTPAQQVVISSVERAGASLSLVGVTLIIVAYVASRRLRTVPNTFILCASVANVGASTACLIGYAGIAAGDNSALCQAQAFLLEMFMQSDPWWSLAMAVNVYLVFFHAANPSTFRRHLWVYCLVCFGVPAIPAVVLLIFQNYSSNEIYGNATLWCWIDDPQSSLRIWSYYLPIWVCILLSALIYVAVGSHVFHQRNQLRNITLSNPGKDTSSSDVRASADKTNTVAHPPHCYGTVTTEVQVTTEASELTPPPTPVPSIGASSHAHMDRELQPWTSPSDDTCVISPTSTVVHPAGVGGGAPLSQQPTTAAFTTVSTISCTAHGNSRYDTSMRDSGSARQLQHGKRSSLKPPKRGCGCLTSLLSRFLSRLRRLDPVKLAYLRTSFVFALSVLVTWTPSSINRVYALLSPHANYPLNLASAVVLPLQGVWNAVIFFTTSWRVLKLEVRGLKLWRRLVGADEGAWGPPGAGSGGAAAGGGCPGSPSSCGAMGGGPGRYSNHACWGGGDGARDIEMCMRGPPAMGTVRVARGSSL